MSSTLLERSEPLTALAGAFADVVATGRGRLALVRGEAGVGKTMLVRRFCEDETGARVLWGACDDLFTPSPLGAFLEIARAAGGELERIATEGARPYEVAAALMHELQSPPAVVVIEDLHWADEATLDVLRIAGRRAETFPALIVVTYRDDELDRRHPARIVLGELALGGSATRIEVEPLSLAGVAALASEHGVDADELYRKTRGNAFFVTEVLASAGVGIPDTARDAVLARAARLSPGARAVLDAVAVVPPHAELWLLDALAPGAGDLLEECLVSGMLRSEPNRVSFRHELARLAVEDALRPDARVALHRLALAALTTPPEGTPDLARLAHHAEGAADADAVLLYAPAAAALAASVGAHREAADHYARALQFGARLEPRERAEMLERRARSCYVTDENPESIDALREALACYRELGDERAQGNVLQMLSEYMWCPGRVAESRQTGHEAVELLEPLGPSRELGGAYTNLAYLGLRSMDLDAARSWSARALEMADLLEDPRMLVAALAARPERDALEEACAVAEQHGFEDPIGWLRLRMATILLDRCEYAEAEREFDYALAFCNEHGVELDGLYVRAYRARAELEQGNWAAAVEWTEAVLRVPRASTTPRILALVVAALVRARRGDPDPWSLLDEAKELADASGELPRMGPVAAAQAEALWLDGSPELVVAATERPLAMANELRHARFAGELLSWRWRAGAKETIPPLVADPYAAQIGGDWERAATQWTQRSRPYEAALARVDSDDEAALRRSLEELQQLGATATAAIVTRKLRVSGARGLPRGPRATTRENPANLTAREVEVLELLAAGLRNAEIAERLVLSVRTVDHHVAAILRKLDVQSRAQATAEAVRLGLSVNS